MNHFFLIFLIKFIINNILKKTKITFTNPLVKVSSLDFKLNIKVLNILSRKSHNLFNQILMRSYRINS